MQTAARIIVVLSWFALFAGWAAQWWWARHGRSDAGRRVNRASLLGMVFELFAFVLLFLLRDPVPELPPFIYAMATVATLASAALGYAAGAQLGALLRIQAVVTAEHKLITSGPYALVRHPIYACLFGFLVATGLVFSRPEAFLAALPVFVIGTEIRIRAEDRLLASHFGPQFEEYRKSVAAWLPGIR